MANCPRYSRAFTLVELLVVISVAAILAAIALPDFSMFIKNNRSTSQINDLQTSLTFARSEAIKRNASVALCKSGNGTACQDLGENWQFGWLVFQDQDLDGEVNDANDILSVHGGLSGYNQLTFTPSLVVYASNGLASSGANGTFTLCDDRGATFAKGLIIGPSGRPRLAIDSDDNGVAEDGDGDDLVCSE